MRILVVRSSAVNGNGIPRNVELKESFPRPATKTRPSMYCRSVIDSRRLGWPRRSLASSSGAFFSAILEYATLSSGRTEILPLGVTRAMTGSCARPFTARGAQVDHARARLNGHVVDEKFTGRGAEHGGELRVDSLDTEPRRRRPGRRLDPDREQCRPLGVADEQHAFRPEGERPGGFQIGLAGLIQPWGFRRGMRHSSRQRHN